MSRFWPVVRDREAVRLVADPLQELQPGVVPVEQDRLRAARDEHLLLALRERDHRHPRQAGGRLHRLERRRELPLAAVDHDEVRDRREALVVAVGIACVTQPREAPRDHLPHRREVVLAVEAPDRERPVVRLLRLRVDEHGHRGDDVAPLQVRDVEALDPHRQALEVERLAQALERLDPAQSLLLGRRRLVGERQLRVLGGELGEPLLLAARRRPHLDRCSAELGEEARERLGVGQVGRDDQLRRHARRRRVVLEAEPLQDRRPVLPFDVLEVEGIAVDQPAVAEREQLHRGAIAVDGEADHVDRADGPPVGTLSLRRGSRSRAAGCGSGSRPRSAPPPPPRACAPRASARSSACRPRGSRSRRRSARGTASFEIAPMQGAVQRSMWKSRHGMPE